MNKNRLALFVILDLLVIVALVWLYFHFTGGARLDRPVTLAPPTADLYLEIASFTHADSTLREISATAGFPVSLPLLLGRDQGVMAKALADPAAAGFDAARPIGLAMSLRFGGEPLAIAFLPVDDAKALATALGIEASALRSGKAVAFEGGWIGDLDGYALIADEAATIDDLLALDTRGLDLPAPEAGAVLTLWMTPNLFATARTIVEGFPAPEAKAARFARELASIVVGSINRASIGLFWSDEGLRLRSRWELDAVNPLTPALAAGGGARASLDLLPPGAFVSGFRIDPAAGRNLAGKALDCVRPLFDDTRVIAMLEKSLDLISREAGTSIITWGDGGSGSLQSVSIQTLPKGREADFVAFQRFFQQEGASLWETLMSDAGNKNATIAFKDLPSERLGEDEISGVEIQTTLAIEPIPGADAEARAALERLRNQRMIQRFAVIEREGAEALFVTAAGDDPAIIRDQIELIRRGGARAADDASFQRVMTMLGEKPVAFMIVDPLRIGGGAASRPAALGLAAHADGHDLLVEIVWPRDHLAAIPDIRFPVPFGAPRHY